MAADDFIRIPVALARANPPGPGRALGRLRLSLAGPIRDLVARFGVAPGSAELSRGGGLLKMDKHGRSFLSPAQMRAVGGYDRAGDKVQVKFFMPLQRHILDLLYPDLPSGDDGEDANAAMMSLWTKEEGLQLDDLDGSGKGVTFRVTALVRGLKPTARLQRMSRRLFKHFRPWLATMWGDENGDIPDGVIAEGVLPNDGGAKKTWMVQMAGKKKRQAAESRAARGPVVYDNAALTRFKVESNDLNAGFRSGDGPIAAPGSTFTQTG